MCVYFDEMNDNAMKMMMILSNSFIEHLERIAEENYSPNLDDILRARAKTVGITEKFFDIDRDFKFRMVDVGGQRNERRKVCGVC